MKKIIAIVLSLLAVAAIFGFAACNNEEGKDNTPAVVITDSAELLNNVWSAYAEEEKFAVIGGDMGTPVDGAPGKYDIAYEGFANQLVFPADAIAQIDDAASIIHMMNANTFTAGAFRTVEGTDVTALTESIKATVMGNQWMCGFPEKLVIFNIEGYVVSAFGAADLIDNFAAKVAVAYPTATAAVSQALDI